MNKKQSLDSDLNRYSHMAHTVLGHKPPTRKHLSEWALYTAAASSALALTPVAEASIIYSGVQNITVQHEFENLDWRTSTAVDLNRDSHNDINLMSRGGFNLPPGGHFFSSVQSIQPYDVGLLVDSRTPGYLARLGAGESI